jgi:hypothetical protein
MNPRLPRLPTLGQFLAAARAQGCDVRTYRGRIIVENKAVGIPVTVPTMQENEQLTQFITEYLCRFTQVKGFTVDSETIGRPEWKPTSDEES